MLDLISFNSWDSSLHSEWQITFKKSLIRIHYSFSANSNKIVSVWQIDNGLGKGWESARRGNGSSRLSLNCTALDYLCLRRLPGRFSSYYNFFILLSFFIPETDCLWRSARSACPALRRLTRRKKPVACTPKPIRGLRASLFPQKKSWYKTELLKRKDLIFMNTLYTKTKIMSILWHYFSEKWLI